MKTFIKFVCFCIISILFGRPTSASVIPQSTRKPIAEIPTPIAAQNPRQLEGDYGSSAQGALGAVVGHQSNDTATAFSTVSSVYNTVLTSSAASLDVPTGTVQGAVVAVEAGVTDYAYGLETALSENDMFAVVGTEGQAQTWAISVTPSVTESTKN